MNYRSLTVAMSLGMSNKHWCGCSVPLDTDEEDTIAAYRKADPFCGGEAVDADSECEWTFCHGSPVREGNQMPKPHQQTRPLGDITSGSRQSLPSGPDKMSTRQDHRPGPAYDLAPRPAGPTIKTQLIQISRLAVPGPLPESSHVHRRQIPKSKLGTRTRGRLVLVFFCETRALCRRRRRPTTIVAARRRRAFSPR